MPELNKQLSGNTIKTKRWNNVLPQNVINLSGNNRGSRNRMAVLLQMRIDAIGNKCQWSIWFRRKPDALISGCKPSGKWRLMAF